MYVAIDFEKISFPKCFIHNYNIIPFSSIILLMKTVASSELVPAKDPFNITG